MPLRNVAIIAHVDHGKTTLVDGLLKQSKTFRENEAAMSQELIMDSDDQERERGITILAKNTSVFFQGTKINIIDTPGHADFGGEVERTLNMADGAILVIDAQEGPMPQTKFVLRKAIEIGLKLIVIVNKIDKRDARVDEVIEETHDLFLDLATEDSHLDFPVYYANGRAGKAWAEMPADHNEDVDLTTIFEAIVQHIPAPEVAEGEAFQMLVSTLDRDDFVGKYAVGRVTRGSVSPGDSLKVLKKDGTEETNRVDRVYVSNGLKRVETEKGESGDIVALTGMKAAGIGDTIADPDTPEALPTIQIEEPTLQISIGPNTSPFAGLDGDFVTGRQLIERIEKELETNVSLRLSRSDNGQYVLSGRGELHLAVFIENLRREGYELEVGKPQVIMVEIDGKTHEPIEELVVDVTTEFAGAVTAEVGRRRGILTSQTEGSDGTTRLTYEIGTRGLLGIRNQLLTATRGTAVMSSLFLRHQQKGPAVPSLRNGALIASNDGQAVPFGINNAQARGIIFIPPQTKVYAGMIVGLNSKQEDIEVNVAKQKQLTNVRASSADAAIVLIAPTVFSLEQSLDFLEDDELLEVTPKALRLRKTLISSTDRAKARRQKAAAF